MVEDLPAPDGSAQGATGALAKSQETCVPGDHSSGMVLRSKSFGGMMTKRGWSPRELARNAQDSIVEQSALREHLLRNAELLTPALPLLLAQTPSGAGRSSTMIAQTLFYLVVALALAQVAAFAPFMGGFRVQRHMSTEVRATIDIAMPALSSTMKEGKIVSWNKKIGEKVNSGDVLLVVESDKADMDVESFEEGYLAAIYTPEGGSADVGAVVAVMVEQQSEIGSVGSAPAPVATPAAPAPAATVTIAAAPAGASPEFEAITMPALSSTMKEGKIVSWSKKVGDKVSSGDMVLVVESDKADMDVESFEEGFLAAITVKDGEVADVGAPVGYLAPSAEAIPAVQAYVASMGATPAAPAAAAPAATAPAATAPAAAPAAAAPAVAGAHVPAMGTVNASPMARKLAAENNIALASVTGTGNFGRVVPDDVLKAAGKYVAPVSTTPPAVAAAASKAPGPAAVQVVYGVQPMSGMQKAVAKNMEKTLDVPVFRVSREIYTDDFDALYVQLKPKGVTVSAMLAKAVAEVLKKHPVVNAAYVDGGVKYSKDVNVAMAVAIDGGLMTPTIVKANEMDLFQIGRVWKELVGKAKEKKLTPAEYSTGTFTISNLGMFGVQQFDAILPPGTGSILAIAASTPKVVQDMSGQLKTVKCMTVTITCDHRHIYGADAAEFLKDLADLIENHSQSLTMG